MIMDRFADVCINHRIISYLLRLPHRAGAVTDQQGLCLGCCVACCIMSTNPCSVFTQSIQIAEMSAVVAHRFLDRKWQGGGWQYVVF